MEWLLKFMNKKKYETNFRLNGHDG
jgi:hypothetical protein